MAFGYIIDKPETKSQSKVGHQPHSITFRGSEWAYIVQIDALSTLSVRKVTQVISGGQQEGEHGVVQQEGEHGVVHQVQGGHYK